MAKAASGAVVRYCGHNGVFMADIYAVGSANVVRAAGPVTMENLERRDVEAVATHHLTDFPTAGFWRLDLGVFVVPKAQVKELQ